MKGKRQQEKKYEAIGSRGVFEFFAKVIRLSL